LASLCICRSLLEGWSAGLLTDMAATCAWRFMLSSLANIFNTRLNPSAMTRINRCSGVVLTGFALLAVVGRLFPQ